MNSTSELVNNVKTTGFTLNHGAFSEDEVATIRQKIDLYLQQPHPGIVKENDGKLTRGLHGPHLYDAFFKGMICDERLLAPAKSLLEDDCYVHQFKVNFKQKMNGQAWPWHQDYIYWRDKDHLKEPKLMNVAILLNDIDMLQGPLCFIPKTHLLGDMTNVFLNKNDWEQDVSDQLPMQLNSEIIQTLLEKYGHEFICGKAGDVLIFDPLTAHCSGMNISPYDRQVLIITYNACSNKPTVVDTYRPDFLSGKDFTPLTVSNNR